MLPSFSRGLRLALVLALSAGFVAWHGHGRPAYAADDEEEDDDEDVESDTEEDEPEEDKDQPAVTAGGLYTIKTYTLSELQRPLTITQGFLQARLGVGADVSDKTAFETFGGSLEAVYGVADNFMVIGGFTNAYNFKQYGVYAGFEGALRYDLIDFRLAANVQKLDGVDPQFGVDIGFPFRYALKPEIAIVALQTFMTINFNAVAGNEATPDLNPSVGVATNPIPELSLVALAQLRIIDFDTKGANIKVPLTARVGFSPNRQLDIGLEFQLLNVKPPEVAAGQMKKGPFDDRFVSLFAQFRVGK